MNRNVLEIVAAEIAAAALVGGAIKGSAIATMHRLDRRDVASAIRHLLERDLITIRTPPAAAR